MATLLKIVGALISGEAYEDILAISPAAVPGLAASHTDVIFCLQTIPACFNQGIISVEKLMDTLIFPFLELAERVSQVVQSEACADPAATTSSSISAAQDSQGCKGLLKAVYYGWVVALRLTIGPVSPILGPDGEMMSGMMPEKFTELVNAMFAAKVPEVQINKPFKWFY